jgi:hypothetical protein
MFLPESANFNHHSDEYQHIAYSYGMFPNVVRSAFQSPTNSLSQTTSTSTLTATPSTVILSNTIYVTYSQTSTTVLTSFDSVTSTLTVDVPLTETFSSVITSVATVTDPATTTTTTLAYAPAPTFVLQVSGSHTGADGRYAQLLPAGTVDGYNVYTIGLVSSKSAATPFNIDAAGHLSSNGSYANTDQTDPRDSDLPAFISFDDPAWISFAHDTYLTCSILPTGALSCASGIYTMFEFSEPEAGFYEFLLGSKTDVVAFTSFTFLAKSVG